MLNICKIPEKDVIFMFTSTDRNLSDLSVTNKQPFNKRLHKSKLKQSQIAC